MALQSEQQILSQTPPSARGQERVSRILEAATEMFLKDGYDATPVDAIVERSGGSKATLYNYFPTKADLFRAVVDRIVASSMGQMKLDTCENIRATLQDFGIARMEIVFSKQHQALIRLVIAERDRFPDLAEMYYERGPRTASNWLSEYIQALVDADKLEVPDVEEAAQFFIGMLHHHWFKEYLLFPCRLPKKSEIRSRVEKVVDNFITLYHKPQPLI